jgi:hypothetical protein
VGAGLILEVLVAIWHTWHGISSWVPLSCGYLGYFNRGGVNDGSQWEKDSFGGCAGKDDASAKVRVLVLVTMFPWVLSATARASRPPSCLQIIKLGERSIICARG